MLSRWLRTGTARRLTLLYLAAALVSGCTTAPGKAVFTDTGYIDQLNARVRQAIESGTGDPQGVDERLRSQGTFLLAMATAMEFDRVHRDIFRELRQALRRVLVDNGQLGLDVVDGFRIPELFPRMQRTFFHGLVNIGLFPNPLVSATDAVFLLPLSGKTFTPQGDVETALRDLFGDEIDTQTLLLLESTGPITSFAGITIGDIAIIHRPVLRTMAQHTGLPETIWRNAVIANEAAHLLLNRMLLRAPNRWPLLTVQNILQSPFVPNPTQVHEFISDVASANTNLAGAVLSFTSLFDGTRLSDGTPNVEHRYALSSEFFLRAFENAEKAEAIPILQRRVYRLQELASASGAGNVPESFAGLIPTQKQLKFIAADYLQAGRRVLALTQ